MTDRTPRLAARLVIVAPDGSVFLQLHDDAEIGLHWAPPGGGLEFGENEVEAALRETAEETGWTDVKVSVPLVHWEHDYTRDGVPVRQSETLYLALGPRRDPSGDLHESHKLDGILAVRWWTPEALRDSKALFWPHNLPELVADARRNGPPERVIELGYVPNPPSGGRTASRGEQDGRAETSERAEKSEHSADRAGEDGAAGE